MLEVSAGMSYRQGVKLLNQLLHRNTGSALKFRTYRDFCERTGKQIEKSIIQKTDQTLEKYGFNAESGKVTEKIASELTRNAKYSEEKEIIQKAIEEINATRTDEDEKIQNIAWQTEKTENTCYVSLDEIGVKHQKEHRKTETEKDGVYVWNTVADVEFNGESRILTGSEMKSVFLFVLAYLLNNNLLAEKSLVFFTDGARNIFSNITELFSFHPHTVILDWFHLKKHCQEYLSMSVKGKEKRNEILQKLLRILWAGNVDEAIDFLQKTEKTVVRQNNRIDELCRYIEKHREHIPPYALRAKLGLKNSSNRVEKANDIIVAQRQKHNGMSWSVTGSSGLAQISALITNGELKSWIDSSISGDYFSLVA